MFNELILWLKQNSILSSFVENLKMTVRAVGGWVKNLASIWTLSVGRIDVWLTPEISKIEHTDLVLTQINKLSIL